MHKMSQKLLITVFLLTCQQIAFTHQSDGYSLSFDDNTMNILVNQQENVDLHLKPALAANDSNIEVKFGCQDADDTSRPNWNSTENKCSILEVVSGYDYIFSPTNSSSIKLTIKGLHPGKISLVGNTIAPGVDDKKAFITVNVGLSKAILTISTIVGWAYFAVWSISFWPQIWENYKRKSCAGLNIDYAMLNIMGFLSYTIFNISLFYIKSVQSQYEAKHPRSQIPVEFNDVVFAVHALFCCSIIVSHYFYYERGDQSLSWFSRIFLTICVVGYIVLGVLVSFTNVISILEVVYIASYVKLAVTLIKYIPQGYYNYKRKSTVGWSIVNIFLDTTGGALSMIQMFMLAYNYDDWATIFNNFTKFGLGMTSILFDLFFFVQHYVLYRHAKSPSTSSLVEESYTPTHPDAKIAVHHSAEEPYNA